MPCPHTLLAEADGGCPVCPSEPVKPTGVKLRALRELARRELLKRQMLERFSAFVREAWPHLGPHAGQRLYWSWHIEAICDHAEAVIRELLKARADEAYEMAFQKLLMNVPPRSAKSIICAVLLPAWVWLQDATLKVRVVSGHEGLAQKHSGYLRDFLAANWFRATFKPAWEVRADKDAGGLFINDAGGEMRCHTIMSKVIGEGSDVTIIDDPHDAEEAASEKMRKRVISRYDSVLSNRVVDPIRNCRIGIMQRLHEADWAGHVLAQGGWVHVVIPLLYEKADPYCKCASCRSGSPIGWVDPRDEEGANLLAERYGRQFIADEKAKGEFHFACQYQQRPAPAEGGIIKKAWLRRQDADQMPGTFDRLVVSVDAATKEKDHDRGSNTSMGLWGFKGPRRYRLTARLGQLDIDAVCRTIRGWHLGIEVPPPWILKDVPEDSPMGRFVEWLSGTRKTPPPLEGLERAWWASRGRVAATLVEDTVMGASVNDVLQKDLPGVVRMKPRKSGGKGAGDDKVSRLLAVQPEFQAGNVVLLRGAEWLDAYEHEITIFPNGAKDDQVDETSQLLNWARGSTDLGLFTRWGG